MKVEQWRGSTRDSNLSKVSHTGFDSCRHQVGPLLARPPLTPKMDTTMGSKKEANGNRVNTWWNVSQDLPPANTIRKEKERVDELRQAQVQLAEVRATLSQQISDLEDEHKDLNRSPNEDPYARHVDIWRNEDESWKMPATVVEFDEEMHIINSLLCGFFNKPYSSKCISWWYSIFPVLNIPDWISMLSISLIQSPATLVHLDNVVFMYTRQKIFENAWNMRVYIFIKYTWTRM